MTSSTLECNVEVRASSIAGNGLFATKDVPTGSTILLKTRPMIAELDLERLQDTCHNCFMWSQKAVRACALHATEADRLGRHPDCPSCQTEGEVVAVKACTGCKRVKYCSKVCQKQAWNRYHKFECKMMRDPRLPPLPYSVRAALQLAFFMNSDAVSEEEKAGIHRLEAHDPSTLEKSQDVMQYKMTIASATDLLARVNPNHPELSRIPKYDGQILRNSLTLITPNLDPIGVATDPLACSANHSCDPNASVLFDAPRLMMRSLAPIKKGEEVFISYVDNTDPFYRRQALLRLRYRFECKCSKCQLGINGRENAWAKPLVNLAPKWSSLAKVMDSREHYSAEQANYVGESRAEMDMAIIQGSVYSDYEPIRQQKDNKLAIEALENVMRTCKQSEMWPITRQPYANIRVDIAARMLDENRVALALFQMAKTYFLIDPILYPQDFHPVRVVHTWNLAKTLVQAYSSPNDPSQIIDPGVEQLFQMGFDFVVPVWKLLKKLSVDVVKSHGAESRLTFMVQTLTEQVKDGIGIQNLVQIERDPLGMWREFEKWAHYPEY